MPADIFVGVNDGGDKIVALGRTSTRSDLRMMLTAQVNSGFQTCGMKVAPFGTFIR